MDDLKFLIYSIAKQVRTCICYCKKDNRLTPMPIAATWIHRLAWIQILNMNIVNFIDFIIFGHMFTYSLRRSSNTCSYFISSSAWAFMKISGAAAKHTHIT